MIRAIPVATVALAALPALAACQRGGLPEDGPSDQRFVVDAAGLIEDNSEQRMNEILGGVLDDTDIELVAVAIDSLDGEPINDFTNSSAGRSAAGRSPTAAYCW
jgi:uncharacterized membrane protein YgcG